jgi:4-hydroxy-3-methylbut-2-enyl diphosphate reductase
MQIKVAKAAGFCWGVKRAMDITLKLTQKDELRPIYTYGPLVHNPQVKRLLEEKGIKAIEKIDEISSGTLVIRSHGIPPQEHKKLEKSGLKVVDATCPRVKAVQSIIKKHVDKGYNIIIAGDKKHPEVAALLGFAQKRGKVVSTPQEIERLPLFGKVCLVAQTTQSEEEFEKISQIVRKKLPEAKIIKTICDSTRKRQEEAKNLAQSVEAMIVVGGKDSGNTKRLVKIAKSMGIPAIHLESEEEIDPQKIQKFHTVGVTAGASTPNWVVKKVVDKLSSLESHYSPPPEPA